MIAPIAALAFISSVQVPPPPQTAEQLAVMSASLDRNRYELVWKDGKLSGTAMEFILQETHNAQFVGVGESHFVKEIPEVCGALFEALHAAHGFNYLAVEDGNIPTRVFSQKDNRGKLGMIIDFVKRYPNAIAFNSDQDLDLLAKVGSVSTAKGNCIWGLDQEFGALHALESLGRLVKAPPAKEAVVRLLAEAKKEDSSRNHETKHYLARLANPDDYSNLAAECEKELHQDAVRMSRMLQQSKEIYRLNALGETEPVGYLSNLTREEYMKSVFTDEYRIAEKQGDRFPKVMLKFGEWHLYRIVGPAWLNTLGGFASQVAKFNDRTMFTLVMGPHGEKGEYGDLSGVDWLRPFSDRAAKDRWLLFDLRPLRQLLYGGRLGDLTTEQTHLIMGFDAVLFLGNAHTATLNYTK